MLGEITTIDDSENEKKVVSLQLQKVVCKHTKYERNRYYYRRRLILHDRHFSSHRHQGGVLLQQAVLVVLFAGRAGVHCPFTLSRQYGTQHHRERSGIQQPMRHKRAF